MGFLPWEKWLPPYIYGPLMCAGSILILCFSRPLRWWEFLILPLGAFTGAVVTWVWLKEGRNIFNDASDTTPLAKKNKSADS